MVQLFYSYAGVGVALEGHCLTVWGISIGTTGGVVIGTEASTPKKTGSSYHETSTTTVSDASGQVVARIRGQQMELDLRAVRDALSSGAKYASQDIDIMMRAAGTSITLERRETVTGWNPNTLTSYRV